MTTKPKARSRIFEVVHETASDLHRLGFIDKRIILDSAVEVAATRGWLDS